MAHVKSKMGMLVVETGNFSLTQRGMWLINRERKALRENYKIKDTCYVVECRFHSVNNVKSLRIVNSGIIVLFLKSGIVREFTYSKIYSF